MDLFDFIENTGTDVFGGGHEQEKIQELIITELGDKIKNLKAEFKDDVVTL
jgi:hypothetical protein